MAPEGQHGQHNFGSYSPPDPVSIRSDWRDLYRTRQIDAVNQTIPIDKRDQNQQSTQRLDHEAQTGDIAQNPVLERYSGTGDLDIPQNLIRSALLMEQELDQSRNSARIYDGLASLGRDEGQDKASVLHSLRRVDRPGTDLPISAISWNCRGHVIAAGYGALDHQGWCRHLASISAWNLAKRAFDPDRPSRAVDLDCCSTCLAFHPTRPGLLAVGLFTGQIMVCDMASEDGADPILMRSPVDNLTHREPVSHLEWVHDHAGRDHNLASISGDGRLLLWSLETCLRHPISGVRLAPNTHYHGHGLLPNKNAILGGSCFGFSPFLDGLAVAGTEGGGLIRCQFPAHGRYRRLPDITETGFTWAASALAMVSSSFEARRHVERDATMRGIKRIDIGDIFSSRPSPAQLYPIASNFAYHPHIGPVSSIQFSPFHRHLFLTSSSDGYIRIFHVMRQRPIISFEPTGSPIVDARWSSSRQLVIAVGDNHGIMHIIDIQASHHSPTLSVSNGTSASSLTSVAYSREDGHFLATGDVSGIVTIWRLSEHLSVVQAHESEVADRLATANAGDEVFA